jgi:hypothetical protein
MHILKIDPEIISAHQKAYDDLMRLGEYDFAYKIADKMAEYIKEALRDNVGARRE